MRSRQESDLVAVSELRQAEEKLARLSTPSDRTRERAPYTFDALIRIGGDLVPTCPTRQDVYLRGQNLGLTGEQTSILMDGWADQKAQNEKEAEAILAGKND